MVCDGASAAEESAEVEAWAEGGGFACGIGEESVGHDGEAEAAAEGEFGEDVGCGEGHGGEAVEGGGHGAIGVGAEDAEAAAVADAEEESGREVEASDGDG